MLFSIKNLLQNLSFRVLYKFIILAILLLTTAWGIHSCSSNNTRGKHVFRIGRASTWYPIQLYGREKKLIAFTNDIAALIAKENSLRFEWVEANPQSLMQSLELGNYDFVLTDLRPNVVNQEHYEFSELVFGLGPVLVVRMNSHFTTLEEMTDKPVGITSSFSSLFNAIRTEETHSFDPLIVTYETYNRALDSLVIRQVDGVLLPAMEAYTATQGLYFGKLKVVTPPFNDEGLRFISLRKSKLSHVIEEMNESLNKMKADGTYDSLISKWDLIDPEKAYWHPTH